MWEMQMMYVIVCDVDEVYVDDLGDVKDSKIVMLKKKQLNLAAVLEEQPFAETFGNNNVLWGASMCI